MSTRALGIVLVVVISWSCSASTPYEPPVTTSPCILEPGEVRSVDLGEPFEGSVHSGYDVTNALVVGEGTLLVAATGTEGSNASWDTELVRVDLETGAVTQLTADDESIVILDARDGRALLAGREVVMMDLDASTQITLGERSRIPMFDDSFASRPRRLLEGETSVWPTEEGVMFHDGRSSRLIFESPESGIWLGWPMLDGGEVFWTTREPMTFEMQILRFAHDELTVVATTPMTFSSLFVDDGLAIWGTDSGISIYDGVTVADIAVGSESGCHDTFIANDVAAFVCDGSIYSYDIESETLTLRAEPDGYGTLGSPRVNGRGALSWLSIDDMCGGTGRLMFEHGDLLTEVADILTDSYCVGHMPIPIELTMTDEYLVWSDFSGTSYCELECR